MSSLLQTVHACHCEHHQKMFDTTRGSDSSIVFSIVAKFFSVNTITYELLRLTC